MVPAEPHLTVTEQESPPAALCIAVRRIFSSHTLSQETSCHAVCLQGAKGDVATAASHRYRLLSWALTRHHPFKQQLGGIRNILPRSVLPLPLRERFVEVKAGTCFFQTCLTALSSCVTVSQHPSASWSAPSLEETAEILPLDLVFI